MIFNHCHLDQKFLDNKSLHKVTQEQPLIVLISDHFTFLNDFILYSLKLNRIHFQLKSTSQKQVMSHQLPAIAFKDFYIAQQNLIQFIGDLMLNRQSLIDMNQRKTLVKDFYKKWFTIIKEQNTGLSSYSTLANLGIQNQQDYLNHLCSLYFAMSSYVKSNILQAKYDGYRRSEINIETLIMFDIIKSVLKLCQKTKADHILRANFESLIDFHQEFKRRIETALNGEEEDAPLNEIEVVSQKQKVEESGPVEYATFSENWKRFSIVFAVATAIYIKWVD